MHKDGRLAHSAALLSRLPADHVETLNRVRELSARWAQRDPGAATGWIETLPAGAMKDWAAYNAARQWAQLNRAAAESWLAQWGKSLENGPPTE